MLSLNPTKSVQLLIIVSYLLYLRQCWLLKFLCFLPVPQSKVCFCMCSVTICKGLYLLHKELAMELGSSWGKCAVCWGCLWANWEDLQARCPHWLMDRLPDGVCKVISRILWCLLRVLAALLLSPPYPQNTLQYSGWGEKEVGLFSNPQNWGMPGAHSDALTFCHWRNHRSRRSLLALS